MFEVIMTKGFVRDMDNISELLESPNKAKNIRGD
jgi:hypothetical protein